MVMAPPGDTDGDGRADDVDRCPDEPEDVDGFQDEDGCPDPDNDGDGVAAINDKCPSEPESFDGVQDEDGCPESGPAAVATTPGATPAGSLAVLGPRGIELGQPVVFATGKAVIDPASFPTLDAVAGILTRQPSLRIEVGVHSDSMGSSAANQALTEARARAVVDYLVRKGIRANRLSSIGYGETKPIADNATPAGRAANRRVELLIR